MYSEHPPVVTALFHYPWCFALLSVVLTICLLIALDYTIPLLGGGGRVGGDFGGGGAGE